GLVGDPCRSKALGKFECRSASQSLLGRDDDYTVCSPRSVDRACRGTLEHLNALNVIRVDVRSAVDTLVLGRWEVATAGLSDRVQAVRNLRVIDDYAVDYIQRQEARVDRRDS